MEYQKVNFHIHSKFSDGENTINEIVLTSLKLGLEYIAITDHFSDSWKSKIIPTLDSSEKINDYINKLKYCKKYLKDNSEKTVLFTGIEIDLSSSEKYIQKLINPKNFDLILFEYLESFEGIAFVKNLVNNWKIVLKDQKLPIIGLAHFDPSFFIHGDLESLMQFLKTYRVYFEFNSHYSEFYSRKNWLFFIKLREYKIPVAVGSDAHDLMGLRDIESPLEMIKEYHLEENYLSFIDFVHTRIK